MKGFLIGLSAMILFAALILGLDFAGNAYGLWSYTFWAPKQANAERKVFVNTNSYVRGKIDYLSYLRLVYKSSDSPVQKAALKETILSEAANVDNEKLPVDLGAAMTDFLIVVEHDTATPQAVNPSKGPKEYAMKIEELLTKLVEHYGQSLLKGGLDPEQLPAVLSQAKYALASQFVNDLAMTV